MGLYIRFRQQNFNAMYVADFVRTLMRHLRGHVVLLWDGAKIHKGPYIEELKRSFRRLHVEQFPGYAPELNPTENVWGDFKSHDANSLPLTKRDILGKLHANKRRVSRSQAKLRSFVLASHLPSPPWLPAYHYLRDTQ